MQLFKLAKELGVESKVLMDLLDKPAASSKLTDEEITAVREEYPAPAVTPTQEETEVEADSPKDKKDGPKVVLFWSAIQKHAIPAPDGNQLIKFEDYKLAALKDGIAYKAIVDEGDPDIRVVIDKPFTDLRSKTEFRQLLEAKIKTGRNHEIAMFSGLSFLSALFHPGKESAEFSITLNKYGVDGAIELALTNKSYVYSHELKGK
jgi:hypothetical protein